MLFTLLAPDECSATIEMRDSQECSQSEYYVSFCPTGPIPGIQQRSGLTSVFSVRQLKVYAILLGDFGLFERKNFVSVFSLCLAVVYSFCASVVLLNVLIAVASDSVRLV
jgi:hypothetical protein